MITGIPLVYETRKGITNWNSLGNLYYGDCVVAAYLHLTMVHNAAKASRFKKVLYRFGYKPPTNYFAIEEYDAFLATLNEKPSPTTGVEPIQFFAWLKRTGKIQDYQKIEVHTADDIKQAIFQNNGALVTMGLTDRAYSQGVSGTWSTRSGEKPDSNFNHAVATVEYQPNYIGLVTWGVYKLMTDAFAKLCTYECWVFN